MQECREFSQGFLLENLLINTPGYMNLTQKSDRKPTESRALRPPISRFKGILGIRWHKDTCRCAHGRRRVRTHVSES